MSTIDDLKGVTISKKEQNEIGLKKEEDVRYIFRIFLQLSLKYHCPLFLNTSLAFSYSLSCGGFADKHVYIAETFSEMNCI